MAPLLHPTTTPDSSSDSDSSVDTKSISSAKLPKLFDNGTTNNYGEWRIQCQTELRSLGLLKYVVGPQSTPPIIPPLREDEYLEGSDDEGAVKTFHVTGNAKEHKQKVRDAKPWMKKNDLALTKIYRTLPSKQLHFLTDVFYASEAWEILRAHYQPRNSSLVTALRSDLQGYRCTHSMDVNEWLNDMQRIYHQLCDMDPDAMSDQSFALTAINNLPQTGSHWENFTAGLRERINKYENMIPPQPVRSIEFVSAIRQEYSLRSKDDPDVNAQIFSARANADKSNKRPRPSDNSSSSSSSPSKRSRSTKTCTNPHCNRKGHEISDCVTYGGGNEGNYAAWWRGPFNIHLPPKMRTKANNVPPSSHPASARINTAQITSTPSSPARANLAISSTNVDLTPDGKTEQNEIILMSRVDDDNDIITTLPVFDADQPKTDTCFFDSGANRHVFNDKTAFESYRPITPLAVHGVGTDCTTKALGRGNVRLQTFHGSDSFSVLLVDVLHIPRARSNLISGGQFDERGVETLLGRGKAAFTLDNVRFLDGILKNRFYHLHIKVLRRTPTSRPSLISRMTPVAAAADAIDPDFYTASWAT